MQIEYIGYRPPPCELLAEGEYEGDRYRVFAQLNDPEMGVLFEIGKKWYRMPLADIVEAIVKYNLTDLHKCCIVGITDQGGK